MELVPDARPQAVGTQSLFDRMRGIGSTNSRDDVTSTLRWENGQLQQQLTRANEQLTQSHSDNQQLRLDMAEEMTRLQQQLTRSNSQRQISDTENQQQIARLQQQLAHANNQRQRSDTQNQQLVALGS